MNDLYRRRVQLKTSMNMPPRIKDWIVGMKGAWFALVVVLVVVLAVPSMAQTESPNDILIVVHKTVSVNGISQAELKNYFLKKKTTWKAGRRVIPIHAPRGSRVRKEFLRRALSMAEEEERIYWEKRKIQAGATEPVTFQNNLKAVFKIKGSLSYVFRSDYHEGVVKVLLTLPAP